MRIYYIYDKYKINYFFEGNEQHLNDSFGIIIPKEGLTKEYLREALNLKDLEFEVFDIPKEHEDYYLKIEEYNEKGIYYGYDKYNKDNKDNSSYIVVKK